MALRTPEPASPESPTRAELLAALSAAIDLDLGQPAEHMLRAALIATRIADASSVTTGEGSRITP